MPTGYKNGKTTMLVIRNLNEDNSFNRVDILGLSKDDFYLIERGVESLLKTQDGYNPDKVCSLLRNLNDNGTFLLNNEINIPMYSQQEVNYKSVDLGLPSGLLWATCNVGATSPEQAGLYFAWGETTGFTADQVEKKERVFDKVSYKAKGILKKLTLEQDAAHVHMGGDWRMPTKAECQELFDNCDAVWTDDYNGTGVAGCIFTSKINGNSVFFPAAGYCFESILYNMDSNGNYWSDSWYSSSSAWYLYFNSIGQLTSCGSRYYGQTVRGVCKR